MTGFLGFFTTADVGRGAAAVAPLTWLAVANWLGATGGVKSAAELVALGTTPLMNDGVGRKASLLAAVSPPAASWLRADGGGIGSAAELVALGATPLMSAGVGREASGQWTWIQLNITGQK